jgi:hypothetical protein
MGLDWQKSQVQHQLMRAKEPAFRWQGKCLTSTVKILCSVFKVACEIIYYFLLFYKVFSKRIHFTLNLLIVLDTTALYFSLFLINRSFNL